MVIKIQKGIEIKKNSLVVVLTTQFSVYLFLLPFSSSIMPRYLGQNSMKVQLHGII